MTDEHIQYTGAADEVVYGRFSGGPELHFERGDDPIAVAADVAAAAVARYPDVHYAPPRCGVETDDGTPCERAVDAPGGTCHQHDRTEAPDDDRPYIRRVRDAEAKGE